MLLITRAWAVECGACRQRRDNFNTHGGVILVKLRLKRIGAKKKPFYRIVVANSTAPRDGKFIETVGTYDPLKNPALVTLKEDRVRYWLNNGVQPTDTVAALLEKYDVLPRSEKQSERAKASETAAA